MRILFRADASQDEGGGHLVRTLVIARELAKRGHDCILVSQEGSIDLIPGGINSLPESNFKLVQIKKKDFDKIEAIQNALASNERPDLFFVDSYRLQKDYQTKARNYASKIAVIDDMPVRNHDTDFLVDPTFNRNADEYENFVDSITVIKTGVEFAPLREEFSLYREESITRRQAQKNEDLKHLVISMGLSDPLNMTAFCLKALLDIDLDFKTTVVIGKDSPYQHEIEKLSEDFKHKPTILCAHNQMGKLLSQCDLVIGGGGSSSWERCCLAVPTVQIILAKNQEDVTNSLVAHDAVDSLGYFDQLSLQNVTQTVATYLTDFDRLSKMSRAAAQICDGHGALRIADELEKLK